jgi:hypothetical protein
MYAFDVNIYKLTTQFIRQTGGDHRWLLYIHTAQYMYGAYGQYYRKRNRTKKYLHR